MYIYTQSLKSLGETLGRRSGERRSPERGHCEFPPELCSCGSGMFMGF